MKIEKDMEICNTIRRVGIRKAKFISKLSKKLLKMKLNNSLK